MTFDTLLAPYEAAFFRQGIMGRSVLYVAGVRGKFREIFSWNDVNRLLQFGALDFPRLRLISAGQELSAESYLRTYNNSGYRRPVAEQINAALRHGSILTIESVEELHGSISNLCQTLEHEIEVPMQADLYCSCRDFAQTALRWNDHEVLVLQIEGSSDWRLHCPTSSQPTVDQPQPDSTADAAWEGSLEAGDLLYIPRWWWYCNVLKGASLCLAIKFANPTGVDLLRRLIGHLSRSGNMLAHCPFYLDPDEQSAYISSFQREVATACASPGLLLNSLKEFREFAEPRVHFNLPWSADGAPFAPSHECRVLPLVRFPRAGLVRHAIDENDTVEIYFNGRFVRFHEDVGRIFERLCDGTELRLGTLFEMFATEITRERVLESVFALARNGVVALEEPYNPG
jgi:hypothetical protein